MYLGGAPFAVRDVEFGCPEADFVPLERGLREAGIFCEVQPWHVLQVRRDDLKVEFGAIEVWNQGLSGPYNLVRLGRFVVQMMNREGLREQYRRGVVATAGDPEQVDKHAKNAAKLSALDAADAESLGDRGGR